MTAKSNTGQSLLFLSDPWQWWCNQREFKGNSNVVWVYSTASGKTDEPTLKLQSKLYCLDWCSLHAVHFTGFNKQVITPRHQYQLQSTFIALKGLCADCVSSSSPDFRKPLHLSTLSTLAWPQVKQLNCKLWSFHDFFHLVINTMFPPRLVITIILFFYAK